MEKEKNTKEIENYKKRIEKLGVKIDKNIVAYNKYELANTNKAVVAYIIFRSMEGKERLINAYKMGACKRWCLTNCCCQGKRFKRKKFFN